MVRWRVGVAVLVVALGACTARPQATASPSEIRIGMLAPLSGTGAAAGRDARRGAELAATLVNDSLPIAVPLGPGQGLARLGGARIKVVTGDTAGSPPRGIAQAGRLITAQQVAGLIGAVDTEVTAAASEQTERLGVPFVAADAAADYLTLRGMNWFFRTATTDRQAAATVLSMLARGSLGDRVHRVGIIHTEDEGGVDAATTLHDLAGEGGTALAVVAGVRPGQDPRGTVERVRAAAPPAVLLAATQPADAQRLVDAIDAVGYRPPVTVAMGAGFTPRIVQGAAGAGRLVRSTVWSAELAGRNPAASQVAALYQRQFGQPMSQAAATTFTATLTLAAAVDAAGSPAPQAVRTALLGLEVPGRDTIMPWGGIEFDASGQNTQAASVIEQPTPDGLRVVFPTELAARP